MIKAYMQVDFNNDLAMRYNEIALKSFERVSDIFEIEVIQCITPDNLLPELSNTPYWHGHPKILPGELGSYHSNYRMMKRLAAGEKFWVMEHDAYLNPEREKSFRKFMSKWQEMVAMVIGTATEIWTVNAGVAAEHCSIVERGTNRGTMSVMHLAIDNYAHRTNLKSNRVYWPANRYKKKDWVNKTGIGKSASQAYHSPLGVEDAPCTQLVDINYGSSIVGRNGLSAKKGEKLLTAHNDLHFVDLDKN